LSIGAFIGCTRLLAAHLLPACPRGSREGLDEGRLDVPDLEIEHLRKRALSTSAFALSLGPLVYGAMVPGWTPSP
jgi:hypothetical protein